jgi:hypothetical protein
MATSSGAGRIPGGSPAVTGWGGVDENHRGGRSQFGGSGGEWVIGIGLVTASAVWRWGTPVRGLDHRSPASMKRLACIVELG